MPDISTTQVFTNGQRNVSHTDLNNIVANATIGTAFFTGKAAYSATTERIPANATLLAVDPTGPTFKSFSPAVLRNTARNVGEFFLYPTGTWGAAVSTPAGSLKCDGSAVSRTTYASLFALFGTVFGTGDGSTTFNLPNMLDNSVIVGSKEAVWYVHAL